MTDKQPEALKWADAAQSAHMPQLAEFLRTQHAEIQRLTSCLKWEQNRADRIGTHGPGCEEWGPAHYECALRAIERKDALLRQAHEAIETDDWMKKQAAWVALTKDLSQ